MLQLVSNRTKIFQLESAMNLAEACVSQANCEASNLRKDTIELKQELCRQNVKIENLQNLYDESSLKHMKSEAEKKGIHTEVETKSKELKELGATLDATIADRNRWKSLTKSLNKELHAATKNIRSRKSKDINYVIPQSLVDMLGTNGENSKNSNLLSTDELMCSYTEKDCSAHPEASNFHFQQKQDISKTKPSPPEKVVRYSNINGIHSDEIITCNGLDILGSFFQCTK